VEPDLVPVYLAAVVDWIVEKEMKAIVLCAGYGARLGKLTRQLPKPMLRLGRLPILEYIICNLAAHGWTQIAVNLHFMPEVVTEYFGDGARLGVEIVYSYETELLGTAGAVRKMADFLDGTEPFLVHYGDVVTDQDLAGMHRFHCRHDALATMLIHQRSGSDSVLVIDEEQRVETVLERPTAAERHGITSPWVSSGVCICSPAVLAKLPTETPSDLSLDLFPNLVSSRRLFTYPLTGYRCAIDSEQRLREAQTALKVGHFRPRRVTCVT
jgi:mannose-1-phosphate guanylyltransferase/phosphomannomutase